MSASSVRKRGIGHPSGLKLRIMARISRERKSVARIVASLRSRTLILATSMGTKGNSIVFFRGSPHMMCCYRQRAGHYDGGCPFKKIAVGMGGNDMLIPRAIKGHVHRQHGDLSSPIV